MNRPKRIIVLTSLIVIVAVCLYFVFFRIFINVSFSEKELKVFITRLFKQNFNKAVQFENAYIDIFGNLVVNNFEISITSDFNDNINLVKSRKTTIGLDFYKIFRKEISVNNITFDNSDITIFKRYGKGYLENFREIFISDINLSDLDEVDFSNFTIEISDSKLFYKEIFKDDKLTVVFEDVNSEINIANTKLSYYVKGVIKPFRSAEIDRGNLSLRGEIIFKENRELYISNTSLIIDNFDLSYMNSFIAIHFEKPFFLYGGFSPDLKIRTVNSNISIDGSIDINNLKVKMEGDSGSFNVVSNENISCKLLLDMLSDFNRIILRKLKIYDDNIQLSLNGIYNENRYERYIDVNFKSNRIDLSEISNYLTPLKDVSYSGYVNIDGRIDYDLRNNISKETSLSLDIDDVIVTDYAKGEKGFLLNEFNTDLKLHDDELTIDIFAKKDKSDLRFRSNSQIYRWHPLKSLTTVSLFSNVLEIKLLYYLGKSMFEAMYLKAYEDKNRGYEEILFTETPLGQLITNNALNLDCKIKRLLVAPKAYLSNLNMAASLEKGTFRLQNFNLSGYEGDYYCSALCYFNQYYPSLKIKGGVRNFNVERFSRDSGIHGELSGTMNLDLDFHTSAYRPAHIVENSIGRFYVEFASGMINATDFQDKVIHFLEKNGYAHYDIDQLRFNRASLLFTQTGENFYVRNFHLSSDKIQFTAHGRYSYSKGFTVPVTALIKEIDASNRQKITPIPFLINGPLLRPELRLRSSMKGERDKDISTLAIFDMGS